MATRHGDGQAVPDQPTGPVVLLGASYASNWKLPDLAGRPVVNKGVAGQESWEMLARFDRDVLALAPSAVILWGYINDIFRAPRDGMDKAMARARASFEEMIGRARAAGIEVILATEVTIRPKDEWGEMAAGWVGWVLGKESYQDYINKRVSELNVWLREKAAQEKLFLLDLQPVLAEASGQRQKAFTREDGSHISPEGYAALSAYAVPLLEEHLRRAG
jgi:lysophospholipase L1-like esterase